MDVDPQEIYQSLLNTGLSEDEIEQKIKKKANRLHGFISPDRVLYLVAKDQGLSFGSSDIRSEVYTAIEEEFDYDEFKIDISEVIEGMTNIVIVGRIGKIFRINKFTRKDGSPGIVGSFILYDNSGNIKVVLWDTHIKIMENIHFQVDELIRIVGGYSKSSLNNSLEVNLGKKGLVMFAGDVDSRNIPKVRQIQTQSSTKKEVKIDDLYGENKTDYFISLIKGTVDNIQFKELDQESGEKSFFLKFILYDDTSSINVVAWEENALNCLKKIEEGKKAAFSNVLVKYSEYSKVNEIHITTKSKIDDA